MSRDYKPRPKGRSASQSRKKFDQKSGIGLWKWMLISAIIIAFVVFLVYLRSSGSEQDNLQQASQTIANKTGVENGVTPKEGQKPEVKPGPKLPQFDFYTILPDKEVVVPEYEIKTRTREERVGKAKEAHYLMQAGSFKTFKEADRLRAKLALMGIESKVEKAKVGSVNWYRVKMGPYAQTDSVNAIRARLRQNGIDVLVTETGQ
ncbi:SPOR domain-containing protein [Methylobacter sp. S3L5C]|uniref:SPOR domain-containing protein n=1 Tax=Methylobacter sp. S3L5C TaxID=2839024 RepID=UPI001FAE379B|nr:SPOR domain-containing protein [Methylobacter sp. S3L5C]UOA09579.1 SPOR domain-containing protein [Methylobacter sp. S3L5C]